MLCTGQRGAGLKQVSGRLRSKRAVVGHAMRKSDVSVSARMGLDLLCATVPRACLQANTTWLWCLLRVKAKIPLQWLGLQVSGRGVF